MVCSKMADKGHAVGLSNQLQISSLSFPFLHGKLDQQGYTCSDADMTSCFGPNVLLWLTLRSLLSNY